MFFFKISVEEKLLQLSPTNLTRYSPMLNSYVHLINNYLHRPFFSGTILAIGYKSMFVNTVKVFLQTKLNLICQFCIVSDTCSRFTPKYWGFSQKFSFGPIRGHSLQGVFSRVCARHQLRPIDLSLGIFDSHFQHTN